MASTTRLTLACMLAASALASRTLVGATSKQIQAQMRQGKYTQHAMQRLDAAAGDIEPQQLHLSLTGDPTSMMLMFVTMSTCNGSVTFYPLGNTQEETTLPTVVTTYSAGLFGWSGSIHTVSMEPLAPGARYTYFASCENATMSITGEPHNFTAANYPSANATTYIAVTADMGTIVPLGWQVAERICEEHTMSGHPFDLVLVAGDLSYATVDPPNNEVEWTWDAFGVQNEPFTSTAPYMTTVGNHENVPGTFTNSSGTYSVEFAAFSARYHMPAEKSNGNQNFWYSYDFGSVHYLSMNTEVDFSVGSEQWLWVENDLKAANSRRNTTPFIVFVLHRPILGVDANEYDTHEPGAPLSAAFEPLFHQYGVDLVIQGHQHEYERTHAVFNGTVIAYPDANSTYVNPGAPIYVIQGSSGAMQEETYVSPIPSWSAVHMQNVYGFGRMAVSGASSISYTFVDTAGVVHDAFKIVKH